jgi:AcrR family transcriptional regulator
MKTYPHSRSIRTAPAPRPLSRRERHSAAVRQRLFDAAMRLFADRGFTQTTVEDITNAADVGKGTFFNYFPSKEELLTAFGDLRIGKIRAALEEMERGAEPAVMVLRRMFIRLGEDPGRSPELARGIFLSMLSSEVMRLKVCTRFAQGHVMMTKMFKIAQERGEVRRDVPAADLAKSFKESYLGSLLAWSLNPTSRLAPSFQRSFEHFWTAAAANHSHNEKKGSER